ncbi:acyltransferase domain-containing protein [Ochrobactrum sp. CM-21-5]|nr:type I polyketide synthase [Ochrobactrum sp. CM-21-5]MBC2885141.1 acyltransferase domain-containing protein [Ochrobactrum sp. CM-21-5]
MDTRIQRKRTAVDPVAIIGMALNLPGDNTSPTAFWDFINSAQVAVTDTPKERFDIDPYHSSDPDKPGTTYSRRAGYIRDPFSFDADFFRISMAEALEMDPQQRWMLQLCWAALENAGILPSELHGRRVALFLTAGEVDYARRTIASGHPERITAYGKLGANRAVGIGRVAYKLGLQGPAIFVDSTCSSSLVAVHLAAQSLRCGDCDLAIAGGTNLILGPEETIAFARLQAMSQSDTCRTFDNKADGYIRGEGGAVVVLKNAQDAIADKDRIEALLIGSSINNDGASNGLTAPNGAAQEAVIRQALAQAGATPDQVAYVETHGTGTPLGDPIELSALRNVYTRDVPRDSPLLLGALKAQIGHLETAAGISGLIKAVLVLRQRQVPAQAGFKTPTTRFRWAEAQMEVPISSRSLPVDGLAAVSAFGLSGTNAHALLAAPPFAQSPVQDNQRAQVLTLSGRSEISVNEIASAYEDTLDRAEANLSGLCYTASLRRQHWDQRLALVGTTPDDMREALRDFRDGVPSGRWYRGTAAKKTKLAFLFPGQGAWRPGVGENFYRSNPIFRASVDDCLSRLPRAVASDVRKSILENDMSLARHVPGQLAHFVILYSLARTWIDLGVRPDVMIGHSLGEHVAAVIADVMSLDDGLKAVEARGRLFEERKPKGAMLAVSAGTKVLEQMFSSCPNIFVAAMNGPEQTVLSGLPEAIAAAKDTLIGHGIRVTQLEIYDTPAHSPLLAPIKMPFREELAALKMKSPDIQLISTLTGRPAGVEMATVDYWTEMVVRPVRFEAALKHVANSDMTFLEVGPGTALTNLVKAACGDWQHAISTFGDGIDDSSSEEEGFAHACARLYCCGHAPDWQALYEHQPPVAAPTYAFEKKHLEIPALSRTSSSDTSYIELHETVISASTLIKHPEGHGSPQSDTVLATVLEVVSPLIGTTSTIDQNTALVAQGFDSLALMEMRSRLQRHFGRAIPIRAFSDGASLRSIAVFYSTGKRADKRPIAAKSLSKPPEPKTIPESAARDDIAITLKEGSGALVALIHPVGGDVICYSPLAEAWPGDTKIIGIRHPGIVENSHVDYRSHAELAAFYRETLIKKTGRVPDFVGGWSYGGSVAQEMVLQWEAEGVGIRGLLMIDSPLPGRDYVKRAQQAITSLSERNDNDLLQQLIAKPEFQTIFDSQHGLEQLREFADATTVDRLFRIHAANMLALARHEHKPTKTPLWYALALRAQNDEKTEDALDSLHKLANGAVTTLGFDCNHFSIMQSPAIDALAGFLGSSMKDRSSIPIEA